VDHFQQNPRSLVPLKKNTSILPTYLPTHDIIPRSLPPATLKKKRKKRKKTTPKPTRESETAENHVNLPLPGQTNLTHAQKRKISNRAVEDSLHVNPRWMDIKNGKVKHTRRKRGIMRGSDGD